MQREKRGVKENWDKRKRARVIYFYLSARADLKYNTRTARALAAGK